MAVWPQPLPCRWAWPSWCVAMSSVSFMGVGPVQFFGVGQRVEDQIDDVPICQGVIDVVPGPPADNQPFAAEQLQPLRDRRELLADQGDDLRHAQLLPLEQVQD